MCISLTLLSHNSEKAKQKAREVKWHTLRDEAVRHKTSDTPLPVTLTTEVVPQGTYNPLQEQQDAEDAHFGPEDMEDDQGPLLGMGMGSAHLREGSSEMGDSREDAGGHMESDDGHADLVSFVLRRGSRRHMH